MAAPFRSFAASGLACAVLGVAWSLVLEFVLLRYLCCCDGDITTRVGCITSRSDNGFVGFATSGYFLEFFFGIGSALFVLKGRTLSACWFAAMLTVSLLILIVGFQTIAD